MEHMKKRRLKESQRCKGESLCFMKCFIDVGDLHFGMWLHNTS